MGEEIKAIETIWAGCRFRSRLEARWAVFFNAIGYTINKNCLYEFEGVIGADFGDGGTYYLPDFYFPTENVYAEVKGTKDGLQADSHKLGECIDYGGPLADGLIILGNIPDYTRIKWGNIPVFPLLYNHKGVVEDNAAFVLRDNVKPNYAANRIILHNDNIFKALFCFPSTYDVANDYEIPKSTSVENRWSYDDCLLSSRFEQLKNAYQKARFARFEHGESPEVINW